MTDKMREEFEKWYDNSDTAERSLVRSTSNPDSYSLMQAHSAWVTWQAAWNTRTPSIPYAEQVEKEFHIIEVEGNLTDAQYARLKELTKENFGEGKFLLLESGAKYKGKAVLEAMGLSL